jgi:hypothetical protein
MSKLPASSALASKPWRRAPLTVPGSKLPIAVSGFPIPTGHSMSSFASTPVLHLKDRFAALADWCRLLRPRGRVIFTDAVVVTGSISIEELNIRASQGPFSLVPPGLNEEAARASGLVLRRSEDRTRATAEIAARWHVARERQAVHLQKLEGEEWFTRRQRFLAMTAELAVSGRLSRFLYVADRPPNLHT